MYAAIYGVAYSCSACLANVQHATANLSCGHDDSMLDQWTSWQLSQHSSLFSQPGTCLSCGEFQIDIQCPSGPQNALVNAVIEGMYNLKTRNTQHTLQLA